MPSLEVSSKELKSSMPNAHCSFMERSKGSLCMSVCVLVMSVFELPGQIFECQSYLSVNKEGIDDAVFCRGILRLATPRCWFLHSQIFTLNWLATEHQVQVPIDSVWEKKKPNLCTQRRMHKLQSVFSLSISLNHYYHSNILFKYINYERYTTV